MLKLEYVLSAPGRIGVFHQGIFDERFTDKIRDLLVAVTKQFEARMKAACVSCEPEIAILFNAFIEEEFAGKFERLADFGIPTMYADSGGLQIITQGMKITEELKKQIYKVQEYADYGMCFDVIPLVTLGLAPKGELSSNERMKVGNKLFMQDEHAAAGKATGANIKAQIESFRAAGAETKAFVIVQGNEAPDMVQFFNEIDAQLTDADMDYIAGIALADTCMGNGVLESIEMMKAGRMIAQICRPAYLRQLHLLGVGSVGRMRPVIYLQRTGYLEGYRRISFDSSSHTCTYDNGVIREDSRTVQAGLTRNPTNERFFREVAQFFRNELAVHGVDEEELLDIIFDADGDWNYSKTKQRLFKRPDQVGRYVVGMSAKLMYIYYQVYGFMLEIDSVFREKVSKDPKEIAITNLLTVKDEDTMQTWLANFSSKVDTNRIKRDENHNTLERWLED